MSDLPAGFDEVIAHAPPGQQRQIRDWLNQIAGEQRRRNADRRDRVLRYPDLAQLLRHPPLSYSDPSKWNGYVPPLNDPRETGEVVHSRDGKPGRKRRRTQRSEKNNSPSRAALVAICAEAHKRDVEAGLEAGDREPDLLTLFPFPFPGMPQGERYDPPRRGEDVEYHGQVEPDDEPAESADYQHSPMRGPGRQ